MIDLTWELSVNTITNIIVNAFETRQDVSAKYYEISFAQDYNMNNVDRIPP